MPYVYDVDRCRVCDAPVIWARGSGDHWMPVDAKPTKGGRLMLRLEHGGLRVEMGYGDDMAAHRPHLATCPTKLRGVVLQS